MNRRTPRGALSGFVPEGPLLDPGRIFDPAPDPGPHEILLFDATPLGFPGACLALEAWNARQWEVLPESERPPDTFELAGHRLLIRPATNGEASEVAASREP